MRTTVSLDDAQAEYVDENRASDDDSEAQAVRDAINRAMDLEAEVESLRAEIDSLREELETCEAEKQTLLDRRDQLERIEQRMATSDEIETYREEAENNGVVASLINKLR